jgi:hypothetical protein
MAEAIFARKKVKKLSCCQRMPLFTAFDAILPWFSENFFMGHSPGNACYRDS